MITNVLPPFYGSQCILTSVRQACNVSEIHDLNESYISISVMLSHAVADLAFFSQGRQVSKRGANS